MRGIVKKSVALTCAYYLYDDWRAVRRLRRGQIETDSGRRHATHDVAAGVSYVERVYRDYLSYGRVGAFSGDVCEIGPGDSFGLALMVLGNGAERVVAVDRYYSRRDHAFQSSLYRALSEKHDFAAYFEGEPSEETLRGLEYIVGEPAEKFFRNSGRMFDYVISRAVMEHLFDPVGALTDMAAALRPGGAMVHRIDLRDHNLFGLHHPLTFLRIPSVIYRYMSQNSGRPNRVLLPAYRKWLAESELEGDIRVTRLVGVEKEIEPTPWAEIDAHAKTTALETVRAVHANLREPFRSFDEQDLAVSGLVLAATKKVKR